MRLNDKTTSNCSGHLDQSNPKRICLEDKASDKEQSVCFGVQCKSLSTTVNPNPIVTYGRRVLLQNFSILNK